MSPFAARFWIRTALYRLTPGGFGYYRLLRRYRDPGYVFERDKHPVRRKHHHAEGWSAQQGRVRYRDYGDYEEYTAHQQQKLEEILKLSGGFTKHAIFLYRLRFYARFKRLRRMLPQEARIVCAGARQGTEVDVLRDLGFANAYGIDLNPGPRNPLVRRGDFMRMHEATSSIDLIYSNCVDHAFHLEQMFAEHARVITSGGYALYDFALRQPGGPFEAVAWECEDDLLPVMLQHFKRVVHVETERDWKWILLRGKRVAPSPAAQGSRRGETDARLPGGCGAVVGGRMTVLFTRGMSLAGWERAGVLEREVQLYRRLSSRLGAVTLLTYGGAEDRAFIGRLGPITLLTNRWGLGANLYSLAAPLLHFRAMRTSSVLKTQQINGAWCAVIAKRIFRKPLIVRCGYLWSEHFARVHPHSWKQPLVERLERRVLRAADRVVVSTMSDRERIVERYGLREAKILVIPNAVDTDLFHPRRDIGKQAGLLCCVGRLDEQKNLFALLDAVKGLPAIHLAIAGQGPLRASLERKALEEALPVEFLGGVPNEELPVVLNRCELFVLPSHYEGHPKALLEAMACGVPVLGAAVPGIRDVIQHGENGYLCGRSSSEIRAAIAELMADAPLRDRLAAKGQAYVETECSLTRAVERELALLTELL